MSRTVPSRRLWRARLPHWRADGVTYYVTFRHRRALDDFERRTLLRALIKPYGRRWDLMIVCVLPESTDLILTVREAPTGEAYELSDVVEKAKTKASSEMMTIISISMPSMRVCAYTCCDLMTACVPLVCVCVCARAHVYDCSQRNVCSGFEARQKVH